MKFLFTRPHPLVEQLRTAGHVVIVKPVDAYPADDDEALGEDYPLSVLIKQIDPDVLVLVSLGHVWYPKQVVLKWLRINSKTVIGITNARGFASRRVGKRTGCNVSAHNCSVFVSGDEATAIEGTRCPVRSVYYSGALAPVLAALNHARSRQSYSPRSPRPWR